MTHFPVAILLLCFLVLLVKAGQGVAEVKRRRREKREFARELRARYQEPPR